MLNVRVSLISFSAKWTKQKKQKTNTYKRDTARYRLSAYLGFYGSFNIYSLHSYSCYTWMRSLHKYTKVCILFWYGISSNSNSFVFFRKKKCCLIETLWIPKEKWWKIKYIRRRTKIKKNRKRNDLCVGTYTRTRLYLTTPFDGTKS